MALQAHQVAQVAQVLLEKKVLRVQVVAQVLLEKMVLQVAQELLE